MKKNSLFFAPREAPWTFIFCLISFLALTAGATKNGSPEALSKAYFLDSFQEEFVPLFCERSNVYPKCYGLSSGTCRAEVTALFLPACARKIPPHLFSHELHATGETLGACIAEQAEAKNFQFGEKNQKSLGESCEALLHQESPVEVKE